MVHHTMISLDESTPNVSTFKEWCTKRRQPWTVIPGRRISTLEEAKPLLTSYGYYIMQNWRETSSHFDSTGPIGCFLAHRDAWTDCVLRNEHTWVFEEGVYAYDTPIFDKLDSQHPDIDLILGHTFTVARMWKQKSIGRRILCPILSTVDKVYFGTKCYRLSPMFAARLLENSKTFDTHVDTYICTEAIRYADEFLATRTQKPLVSAKSSGTINHSIDHSVLILCLLVLGIVVLAGGSMALTRLYKKCRSTCQV